MKKLISLLLILALAMSLILSPAAAAKQSQPAGVQPDLILQSGEDAECALAAGKAFVICLKGAKGETVIEAESAFALKMEIRDEKTGDTKTLKGKKNELFRKTFTAKGKRTYLITVTAANGKSAGTIHIRIGTKKELSGRTDEAEEQRIGKTPEDLAENGNVDPDAESAAMDIPTIKKITQNNTAVKLSWMAVSGAKKYEVSANEGWGWQLIATVTGTSYTHKTPVTRATSGSVIKYRVRAVNGSKKGGYATKSLNRLASPGTVKLKKGSKEDTITASWSAVTGAEQYYVYYRAAGQSSFSLKKVSGSATKATIPAKGTKKNEVYVQAVAGGDKSKATATKSLKPYWYRVVLIGNYEYYDMNNDLPGVKYDVSGMATLFGKQTSVIKKVYNASAGTILNAVRSTFSGASANTVCVFMYSGHGYTDYGYWSGALACSDGTSVHPSTLKDTIESCTKSQHIVILLGSCGSGGFIDPNDADGKASSKDAAKAFNSGFISAFQGPVDNAGEFATKRYSVLTGAAAHQVGWVFWWTNPYGQIINGGTDVMRALGKAGGYEYCDWSGNNMGFTQKYGDTNGDKKLSMYEAFVYARNAVKNSMADTPSDVQFWSTEQGLILFQ